MSTDDSTSEFVTTVIAISITSLLVAVLFSTCGFLVGMMVPRAIYRYQMRLDSNAGNNMHPPVLSVAMTLLTQIMNTTHSLKYSYSYICSYSAK